MDVSWNKGDNLVVRQAIYATPSDVVCALGRVAFELPTYVEDVEVRVYVAGGFAMRMDGITLEEDSG